MHFSVLLGLCDYTGRNRRDVPALKNLGPRPRTRGSAAVSPIEFIGEG